MSRLHDLITVGDILVAVVLLLLLDLLIWFWKPLAFSRLAMAVGSGLLLTACSMLVSSTGHSGMVLRTRYGLPHFAALSNYDPATKITVTPLTIDPLYLCTNLLFWCALALLVGLLVSARLPHKL